MNDCQVDVKNYVHDLTLYNNVTRENIELRTQLRAAQYDKERNQRQTDRVSGS